MKVSQTKIIKQYYLKHPNRNISHPEVVDWAEKEYKKLTGNKFRDPDRAIRKLHQEGFLVKISKGIYKYDPNKVITKSIALFSPSVKAKALKRDKYKCVICGMGVKEGLELHIDHIRPIFKGGDSKLSNAQILCSRHNFIKKNLNQTETGKKMFIRLYRKAKDENSTELIDFCKDILKVFNKHDMNGHIEWTE